MVGDKFPCIQNRPDQVIESDVSGQACLQVLQAEFHFLRVWPATEHSQIQLGHKRPIVKRQHISNRTTLNLLDDRLVVREKNELTEIACISAIAVANRLTMTSAENLERSFSIAGQLIGSDFNG